MLGSMASVGYGPRMHSDSDRRFRRRWVGGTTIGWVVGFVVGLNVASSSEPLLGTGPLQSVLAYAVLGAFVGLVVGLMQWRVLRRRISQSGAWVTASVAGLGIAGGAGYGLAVLIFGYSRDLEDLANPAAIAGWALVTACGGAIAGLLQWRVLRSQVRQAGSWVAASTLGWGLSAAAMGTVAVASFRIAGDANPGLLWFLGAIVAAGIVLGVITGAAIARRLLEPSSSASFDAVD